TTDIIVGFPGETEEDFRRTLELTEQVRYENQFSFVFSARPRTVAALKEEEWGPVPHEVKVERLERLQAIQRRISGEIGAPRGHHGVRVRVGAPSKPPPPRRCGRPPETRTVISAGAAPAGARARVRIPHGSPSALLGVESGIVDLPPVPPPRPRTEAA